MKRRPAHKSHFGHLPCGFRLHRIVYDGVPQVETEAMRSGTRLHKLRVAVRTGQLSTEDAVRQCESADEIEQLTTILLNNPWPEREPEWEAYFAVNHDGEFVDIPPEEEGEARHNVAFAGIIDQLLPPVREEHSFYSRKVIVEDLKTGRVRKEGDDEADMYAYGGYALATARGHEVRTVDFYWFWSRLNLLGCRSYAYTPMASVFKRVMQRIEWLHSLPPSPIPGGHCFAGDGCQFLGSECPLGIPSVEPTGSVPAVTGNHKVGEVLAEVLRTNEITPANEVVVAFGAWWFDTMAGKIGDLLKAHIDSRGEPIRFGDYEWSVGESDGSVWDQEIAFDVLKDEKLPAEDQRSVLRINSQSVARLRKTQPEVAARLYREARIHKPAKKTLRCARVKA